MGDTMRVLKGKVALLTVLSISILLYGCNDDKVIKYVQNVPSEEVQSDEKIAVNSNLDPESSKNGFKTYKNERFGFVIDYPSKFIKDTPPEEGYGIKLCSEDKKAILTATGKENIFGEALAELYQKDINYIESITTMDYKASSNNWYVVSWVYGGEIFYKRVYVGDGAINTMLIRYPESEGHMYNHLVEHISPAFKPGNLSGSISSVDNGNEDILPRGRFSWLQKQEIKSEYLLRRYRAREFIKILEEAINSLKDLPNSGSIPIYSILKKHLVFYKVNDKDKTVIIYAIVDGRREYKNLIQIWF